MLKQKIALIMGAAVLVMVSLNAAVLLPVAGGFAQVEDDLAEQNAGRVREAIAVQLESLARNVKDWSHWDATYRFVADDDDDYAPENLELESLQTLGINLMYFYTRDADVVWGQAFDLETGAPLDLPRFAPGALAADDLLLEGTDRHSDTRGILSTAAGPMLVVSSPIVPSADTGPANGTLVFGRLLDEAEIAAIRRQVRVDFDIAAPTAAGDAAGAFAIAERRSDVLVGRETLNDLYGQPVVEIRSMTPRDVTQAGDQTIGLSLFSLVIVGLVDIAIMWFLIQRFVLRPLSRVSDRIQEISDTGHLDKRVPASGTDECGVLAREFNRMLDRIAEARQQLVDQTSAAESARFNAERANEAKTTFLTNMSHELRTPLNAIIGFSELMLRGALGPIGNPKYKEYVSDISASGQHLLDLINTILNLAQASSGKLRLDEETVRIADVVDTAMRLVHPQAIEARVAVTRPELDALPDVRGDRTKLAQILINILSNAIKFTPEGGQVRLAADRRDTGALEIRISDTGIGMRPQDIPRALKPFVQVHQDRSQSGTGLGLPLSLALVELHGGQLTLESAVGAGTTVTIRLPAERVLMPALESEQRRFSAR